MFALPPYGFLCNLGKLNLLRCSSSKFPFIPVSSTLVNIVWSGVTSGVVRSPGLCGEDLSWKGRSLHKKISAAWLVSWLTCGKLVENQVKNLSHAPPAPLAGTHAFQLSEGWIWVHFPKVFPGPFHGPLEFVLEHQRCRLIRRSRTRVPNGSCFCS